MKSSAVSLRDVVRALRRLGNVRVSLTQSMIMSVPPIAVFVSMYATVRVCMCVCHCEHGGN